MKLTIAVVLLASFAWAAESEAKRAGGGRSSGASREAAKPGKPKQDDEAKAPSTSSGNTVTIRVRSGSSQPGQPAGAQQQPGFGPAAAGVALGAAAGSAGAAALSPEELKRRQEERRLRDEEAEEKKRAEKEKRELAFAAVEKRRADEKLRQDKLQQEKEAKARKAAEQSQCVFKPVMTDDEIAKCREVRR